MKRPDGEREAANQRITALIEQLSQCALSPKSTVEPVLRSKWKFDENVVGRRQKNSGVSERYNTTPLRYWDKDPSVLAVGTSLSDQSLSEEHFRSLCPSVNLTKVKLFTISKDDGKISPERNILERLQPEVTNSHYDFVVIEVGVNEVSNCKNPAGWDEYITDRLKELSSLIKEIQDIQSDLKFVILNTIHRIDSNRAQKLGKEMNRCIRFEFIDQEKVCVKTLKMTTASRKDRVNIFKNENTLCENTLWKHRKNCECCPVSQLIVR